MKTKTVNTSKAFKGKKLEYDPHEMGPHGTVSFAGKDVDVCAECGEPVEHDPHPKREKGELTVGEVQTWLDKLEKITSVGAKIVHVRHLLERASHHPDYSELVKKIEEMKHDGNCRFPVNQCDSSHNHALDAVLKLIKDLERGEK